MKNLFRLFLISLLLALFAAPVVPQIPPPAPDQPSPVIKKKKKMLTECPQDMEYIIVDYNPKRIYEVCIDRYEYPNQKGTLPMTDITWYKANKMCEDRGKYLCWDREWLEACMGINNWDYAYYNVFDAEKCNVQGETFRPSGDFPECKTRNYEVYDLIGNVREWTAGGGIGAFGGAFKHGRGARCSRWDPLSLKESYKDVGFRCCVRVNTGRYGKVKRTAMPAGNGLKSGLEIDTLGPEPAAPAVQ